MEIFGNLSGVKAHFKRPSVYKRQSHQSALVLGTAAEVELGKLLPSEHPLQLCCATARHRDTPAQPEMAINTKLDQEAASPSAAYQGGRNLLSEAKRPAIKECSQYNIKGFPGTDTTAITAISIIQVVCFRNEFHTFSNSCTGLCFKNL